MALRERLMQWVVEALQAHDGSASILQVHKYIWDHHESELRGSGDAFFTWQYDVRWAANKLRDDSVLQPKPKGDRGPWRLA